MRSHSGDGRNASGHSSMSGGGVRNVVCRLSRHDRHEHHDDVSVEKASPSALLVATELELWYSLYLSYCRGSMSEVTTLGTRLASHLR